MKFSNVNKQVRNPDKLLNVLRYENAANVHGDNKSHIYFHGEVDSEE